MPELLLLLLQAFCWVLHSQFRIGQFQIMMTHCMTNGAVSSLMTYDLLLAELLGQPKLHSV